MSCLHCKIVLKRDCGKFATFNFTFALLSWPVRPLVVFLCAGNGKRSDPSMEAVPRPSLLRQLLLRNSPAYPMAAGPLLPDVASDESFSSEYPDFAPAASPADQLSALVNTLVSTRKQTSWKEHFSSTDAQFLFLYIIWSLLLANRWVWTWGNVISHARVHFVRCFFCTVITTM